MAAIIKHAVISGAGSGIGQAIARALYLQGASLTLLDLHLDSHAISTIIGSKKQGDDDRVQSYELDIRHSESVWEVVSGAVAKAGSIDFAINCAGINITAPFEEVSSTDFSAVIDINLKGSCHFSAAVLPHMRAGSHLALIASMGGLLANYAYSAYSSSKFAVVGLAEVLRMEYAPKGIGVSVICPPEVPTPMVEKEMLSMHPVQRALKDTAGVVTIDELVSYVLERTWRRRRFLVIPGRRARLSYYLSRLIPKSWMHFYTDAVIRRVLKRHQRA